MVRRGSTRLAVVLGAGLVASATAAAAALAPADAPPPPELDLPPLSVPAPPVETAAPVPKPPTAPASAVPPALESLPPLGAPIPAPVAPAPVAAVPLEIPPDRRPVLAVPGLPTPRVAPMPAPATTAPAPASDPGVLRLPTGRPAATGRAGGLAPVATLTPSPLPDGPPPLVPPAGDDPALEDGPPPLVPPAGAVGGGRPRLEGTPRYNPGPDPDPDAGTLALEPIPDAGLAPLPGRRDGPDPVDAGVVDGNGDDDPLPTRAPSRRRLFGLLRPAPAPAAAPPAPLDAGEPTRIEPREGDGRGPGDTETIRVQPRSDPAADAALKRRLESQIRSAMGNQLKALDVRVVDRTVYVRAAVARFWQKRSAKRTLESLPALAGYRTRIEVLD
jgi:hypothetical protein